MRRPAVEPKKNERDRRSRALSKLRDQAWKQAHAMSAAAAEDAPPVALHSLASALRIRHIELLPMLCTAAIGPAEGGYVVYINSTASGADDIAKERLELTAEDFARLNVRLRFSVAHEMAHVFFFNALGGDCRSKVLQDHWEALENSCSQMARAILLPKKALLREIGGSLFAPARLVQVAKRFRVSPQVLIYRLRLEDMRNSYQRDEPGLVACVDVRGEEPMVIARHAVGDLGKGRWPSRNWQPAGSAIKTLQLCADVADMMKEKEQRIFDANVFWRQGQVAPATVEIQWYNSSTAILSIRMHGHLETFRHSPAARGYNRRDGS